ncbi:MAG: IgGFc-binding protein [Bacteroidota bacterium]|nr:IgGFc-binding protein [Bacteroidota bacterium]
MKRTIAISWIILVLGIFQAHGQSDTLHWFAAPDITNGHSDQPIFLRIVNGSLANRVVVSMPADPTFPTFTLNIPASQSRSIDLTPYKAKVESGTSGTVTSKGIKISATYRVQAFYEIVSNGNNKDLFSLKGQNGIGTNFIIPGQNHWWNDSLKYNPKPFHAVDIVATQDGTQVTIIPTTKIRGVSSPVGQPFTVTLRKGETYSLKGQYYSPFKKLIGTEVNSNKPIAITYCDDSNKSYFYGGCSDVMGDQIVPLNILGTEYVAVRGHLNGVFGGKDRVFITATQNNTKIYIAGNTTPYATINKGQVVGIPFVSSDAGHIVTNNPVYVMQVSGFGCEVGCAILPPVFCTGSNEVEVFRTSSEDFYLLILVKAGGETGFWTTMSNTTLIRPQDFLNVPGTGGQWKYLRKKVDNNNNNLPNGGSARIGNNVSRFHLSVINGGNSTGCLFGYFSDFIRVRTDPIYHY